MDSSGLKYTNLDQLIAEIGLKEQQTRQFEQKPLETTYTTMKKLLMSAEKARGELEEQYRLFYLAGELAAIMRKNQQFAKWIKNGANNALFRADYENVVEGISKLQPILKKKYESGQLRRDQLDRAAAAAQEAQRKAAVPTASMRSLRAMITPRELVRKVEMENPKKSALIFDLRQNQSDSIFYVRSEMITIIQVPYDAIDSTLTFQSLRTNLAVNQRALLPRVSASDFVVLMDDESPELLNSSPAPKTKLSFLFKALTQYNQTERPRERPMFMEGGFKMWKAQYPNYTRNEQPVSARSIPSDDLDEIISAFYSNYASEVSHIRYPDLMANPLEPKKPPPVQVQPVIPPRPPQYPPEQPTEPPKAGFGVYPNPNIMNKPSASTPSPPVLDRPGPPIFSPKAPPTPPVLPYPDRTAKPAPLPERPADPSPPPPPQPIPPSGPSQNANREIRHNGGLEIKRPPLLDRATKPTMGKVTKDYELSLLSIHDQITMAIQRSSRRSSSLNPGATGLFNMGNTCFMSATLQCLFQTPGLPEVFTKKSFVSKVNTESRLGSKGIFSAGFSALCDAIWEGGYEAIKPARFLQLFADVVSPVLSDGRQHDASEFQIFLLDALHEDTNQAQRIGYEQNYKGGASIRQEAADFLRKHYMFSCSPVNKLLGSISVSEIRCETCRETSATFEENTIISVELTSTSTCSLENCLRSHFSSTRLDGDSRWNCPKCRQPRASTRSSKLWALPSVLIIHLKRFALFNGEFEKNSAAVQFDPTRFDARPFLHEAAPTERTVFKLYAATIHNGRLNSGHYTAVSAHLKSDKWLRFDDESVRACDRFQVDPSLAYILFYKRC